jgi:4'-phosphopantetheinyl transferase
VLGRACLRILLGTALDLAPQAVSFTENPYGKPETPGVSFNVAHSRDTILIALRRDGPVGVDIEWINPAFDAMEIAQSAFHPDEIAQLVSILDADGQRRAFYALWTRKEALAKADGRGLSLPLHSFAVPLHPAANVPIALPASGRPPHGPPQTLFLNDIRVGDHFAAALALNAPDCRLSLLDFPIAAALAAF